MIEEENKKEVKRRPIDRIILGIICGLIISYIFLELVITDMVLNGDNVLYDALKLGTADAFSIIDEKYKFINDEEEYQLLKEELSNQQIEEISDFYKTNNNKLEIDSDFFENKKLLVLYLNYADSYIDIQDIKEKNNDVKILLKRDTLVFADNSFVCLIPVSKNINNVFINYMECATTKYLGYVTNGIKICITWIALYIVYTLFKRYDGWKKVLKIDILIMCPLIFVLFILSIVANFSYKPIIYLYPTEETEVSVNLGKPYLITSSYPKYTNGWEVIASTNGDLKDEKNDKDLYALYYENENVVDFKVQEDGFLVKGEKVAEFLEEKLSILGLTDREKEEFIIYWLPKLEVNKYNYIRFATKEEIDINMPLSINPKPDTIIRVLMTYKKLNWPIEVIEQELETPERTGFVAVEWGGTEIK